MKYLLVSEPFPEPNNRRPNSITGNMADVPFRKIPAAKTEDPIRHRDENRNTPTGEKFKRFGIVQKFGDFLQMTQI